MRIIFLLPMGIERPSGRRYFQIARELVQQGNTVRLLALHPDLQTCNQRRFIQDGVEVWYVGQMHARKSTTTPSRFSGLELVQVLLTSTLGLLWGIICSPGDIYHLGKPQPVNGIAAIIGVLLLRHCRFYVDCDDDEVNSNHLTGHWQRAVFGFWQWLLPRIACGVTVNTHFLQDRLLQAGVRPIVYVPNGVDLQQWHSVVADGAGPKAELVLTGRRLIAYAGTVALHNHPVDLLVQAFATIAPLADDVALLIIGGGEDVPRLQHEVKRLGLTDRVYFTGHVSHEEVRRYLAGAAVSVDPVIDDAVARARSPLKLFESMAIGVPVITGAVGDRPELLDHGRAGLLVMPGDSSALADGILMLLQNEAHRTALAEAGRVYVQRYSWGQLARCWSAIYHGERQ